MSSSRSESDLAINIRKATSIEETAPKRKHVRAAIVYTWDHKSSQSFWAGMKVQPILADEIQTFKALITIHRVLQEGHKVALEEAQSNIDWLKSLARGTSSSRDGYGSLIKEYVAFLVLKLAFHREHRQFNGLFEYEEVVSLRTVNDPDSGYQAISSLMNLQDQIENFQKSIFASFRYGGNNNECRIAGLVPLVLESYGIYRFITSMLRAMHTITDNSEALAPLVENFNSQFYRLRHFYYECANLKYLTSLISVPKLPSNPPNLQSEEDAPPGLPARPKNETPKPREPSPPPAPPKPAEITPEPMNNWWEDEQRKQQEQYDAQQRALQQQWQQQQFDQQQSALRQQQEFENQQRLLAEQQRLAQEQFQREQAQAQISGRMAELEQENMNARAQYERDQLMLKQYDQQVKDIEEQLQTMRNNFTQQIGSKDDQIRALQEQVNTWRSKYEALAKLYSQLRTEHLELLQKFKNVQLKAASAQEAIDKKEKLERELKTKNLELADMIRERDRALHDRDRLQGGNKEELEKLKRELRMALDRAEDAEKAKGNELSAMLSRYNREMADLEEALRVKSRALDDFSMKNSEGNSDLERLLRDREEELEILKSAMDQTLLDLHAAQTNGGDTDKAMDEQIDMMLLAQVNKINSMIDSVLEAGMQRIDDAVYELDSSMTAGNQNATAPYVLSQIEKASSSVSEFSMAFNNFIADGPGSEHAEIIKTINVYSSAIADVLSNTKGLTRFASEEKSADQLINTARTSAQAARNHFRSLQSANLDSYSVEEKIDVVINLMHEVLMALQKLSKLADAFTPKNAKLSNQSGDIGDVVDRELANAAKAIDAAVERLNKLRNKPRSGLKEYEIRIHDSILEAALAVTGAISQLIKAATAAQQEIVAKGRGSSSKTSFYKKNNRWTEGLISAAKAVANSTNTLIETADAVIVRNANMERLIVASNDVAASTAQLVAASRVKADFGSRTQDTLEEASKAVGRACRSLVRKVQEILKEREDSNGADREDFASMDRHEFKIKEMEQQVEILQLENALGSARKRLGEMRKISYQEE